MGKIKGSKNGIFKNDLYGVKVAFEYIEKQCKKEHLPIPNINGGTRTRLIQGTYSIKPTYWNGVTTKGAVYKYRGEDLWKFIDLFMDDYRKEHPAKTPIPEQLSVFDDFTPDPTPLLENQKRIEKLLEDQECIIAYPSDFMTVSSDVNRSISVLDALKALDGIADALISFANDIKEALPKGL